MGLSRRSKLFLAAPLTLILITYLVVSFMMVRGATSAERKPFETHPSVLGLEYEDVSFKPRGDGPLLRGWYLESPSDGPAVAFVHGIGGQRSSDNAVLLGEDLVGAGYDVLLFDLRGHGESDGDRISGGYFERRDVLGAYELLVQRGAAPGTVGLIGFSMGAGIAVMAAAQESGIAAVVADSPFAHIDDLIAQETARKTPLPRSLVPLFLPAAKLIATFLYDIELGDLAPEKSIHELAYPVLVIHGEADSRIPVSHGRRVHANAAPGSQLWTLSGVEHADAYLVQPHEYSRRVISYLDSRLRQPAER